LCWAGRVASSFGQAEGDVRAAFGCLARLLVVACLPHLLSSFARCLGRATHRISSGGRPTGCGGGLWVRASNAERSERIKQRCYVDPAGGFGPASLAGTVFDLHGETTVGRAPGCGVVIDDQRVSKLHARLYPSGGRWAVEDLGSTNGTLLNDGVVDRPRTAGPGDRVQVGEHVLELL